MEKVLLNFLLDLNEQGLINNHDFDYEKVARAFVNKDENKQLITANVCCSTVGYDFDKGNECSDFDSKPIGGFGDW